MKKIKGIIFVSIIVLWTIHLFRVNASAKTEETIYGMQETFLWNSVEITPISAHIYTEAEYQSKLDPTADIISNDGYYLCMKIQVKNQSIQDISWDTVFNKFGYGFESDVWCSVDLPQLNSKLNHFPSETLKNGFSQEVWFVTTIDRICFEKRNQDKIPFMQYYYVLSIYPRPIKIKLDITP